MRWIFISPHFDDAVLSCGGLIWELTHSGTHVEILTVNAGDPPAGPVSSLITRVHAVWKTGSPMETVLLRRNEDLNAAAQVGAVARHLSMVDAIYRRAPSGSLMYPDDVFDPIHPEESDITQQTSAEIRQYLLETDTLVCPLALGGHVDHVITRRAVESLGRPVWYYADIPYLFRHEAELTPAVTGKKSKTFLISDSGLKAWQTAIEAHASQLSSLFIDVEDMRSQIRNYCAANSGLVIWTQI